MDKLLPRKLQYHAPEWKKFRNDVFKRDNYTCTKCGDKVRTQHAHHIRYAKGKYVWEVPMEWVITVCDECHSRIHCKNLTSKKSSSTTSVLDFF
jgi:5-methylcytosine-specific restriction endonuclease McrA